MWKFDGKGETEFTGGRDDWEGAARMAASCPHFRSDVEEEQVADERRSCYNCRYRRWTVSSFTCLHGGLKPAMPEPNRKAKSSVTRIKSDPTV